MSHMISILYLVDPSSWALKKLMLFWIKKLFCCQIAKKQTWRADQNENITGLRKKIYLVYFKVKVSVILKLALKLKTSDATCSPSSPESHLSKTSEAKKEYSEKGKMLRRWRVIYPLVLSSIATPRYGFNLQKNSLIDGGSISKSKNCAGRPSNRCYPARLRLSLGLTKNT